MATGTVSAQSAPVKSVSPIVSAAELAAKYTTPEAVLVAVSTGAITPESAGAILRHLAPPAKPARVLARRTAKGSLWMSLGYKAAPGKQNSCTLPREGWDAIVKLVKDGTIPGFLVDYANIPLSAAAQG